MSDNVHIQAQRYAQWKRRLWGLDLVLVCGVLVGWMMSGLSRTAASWVMLHFIPWPMQVAVYGSFLGAILTVVEFPLDGVRSFLLEHRFSLSNQTASQWLVEYAKKLILGGLFGLVGVEALSWLLRAAPKQWWLWAALLWMAWSVVLTRVAPAWLIPIFYRQEPLGDSALQKRLESLLVRCGARVSGIYQLNLSTTTKKANACLCGLGKSRRVLVSDTLLSVYPLEEVEVVLAHEVGHHQLHHIGILLALETVASGVSFFLVDAGVRAWAGGIGIASLLDLAALPAIGLGLVAANLSLMPVTHGISRRLEAQADGFALEKTQNVQAFVNTMRRLSEQNLAEIQPPRWVEWLLYDHPPIAKRIAAAQAWMKPAQRTA